MSTILTTHQRDAVGGNIFQPLGRTLKRWWVAYMTWRIEEAAIVYLGAMSDRELGGIGLIRSDIRRGVADRTSVLGLWKF